MILVRFKVRDLATPKVYYAYAYSSPANVERVLIPKVFCFPAALTMTLNARAQPLFHQSARARF